MCRFCIDPSFHGVAQPRSGMRSAQVALLKFVPVHPVQFLKARLQFISLHACRRASSWDRTHRTSRAGIVRHTPDRSADDPQAVHSHASPRFWRDWRPSRRDVPVPRLPDSFLSSFLCPKFSETFHGLQYRRSSSWTLFCGLDSSSCTRGCVDSSCTVGRSSRSRCFRKYHVIPNIGSPR